MRTIVQISDLHFGTILEPTIEPLVETIRRIQPDLVVTSGDLTQRARRVQYADARAFLDRLPDPQLVIPGNHDVPAYNLYRRFAQPLERYKKFITHNLDPAFIDDEIAVLTMNTARAMVIKGGRVSHKQVEDVVAAFHRLDQGQARIVVTHHPFDLPPGLTGVDIVARADMAMPRFAQAGVEMFLAGHLHLVYFGSTSRYNIPGFAAPIVQAGTATSTRARGEPNSFNVIRVSQADIEVEVMRWEDSRHAFVSHETRRFPRAGGPSPATPRRPGELSQGR
ncbi:MAG: metallophosphoesterase [Gemmatimonadota bacterium]